jgi:hypothetical protein
MHKRPVADANGQRDWRMPAPPPSPERATRLFPPSLSANQPVPAPPQSLHENLSCTMQPRLRSSPPRPPSPQAVLDQRHMAGVIFLKSKMLNK